MSTATHGDLSVFPHRRFLHEGFEATAWLAKVHSLSLHKVRNSHLQKKWFLIGIDVFVFIYFKKQNSNSDIEPLHAVTMLQFPFDCRIYSMDEHIVTHRATSSTVSKRLLHVNRR